ncbi:MAG: hypothetical protein R3E82_21565 [Pseudomonadales bacterium]
MKDTRNSLKQSILYIIALLLCSLAIVSVEANTMEIRPDTTPEKSGKLSISVSGASAGITTDYFEQALSESIVSSGIFPSVSSPREEDIVMPMIGAKGTFSSVVEESDAPYELEVRIVKIDAPSFSIRMDVGMDVVWELRDRTNNTTVLQENIHSSYRGGAFEGGFNGASRVRAAVEGATRENIRIGIEKLASLELATND